jgi:nitroimidazol reductase NimA-like FMN-containing flavoprotein (pyridoxamine 5'-phosphate oxidase superfamily)
MEDVDTYARDLIDANRYVTLGTADGDGTPWVSPVYFATSDYAAFYWMSTDDAEHSKNIADRPQVSMVIFDSQVPPYHARAVYLSGAATEVAGDELARALEVYPGPMDRDAISVELADVVAPSRYRMYRADVTEASVLCPREPRQPCHLHGRLGDHRTPVTPWRLAQ